MRCFVLSLVIASAWAATSAPAANPKQLQPCVIVKRHVYKFGENMSRFHPHRALDYVEGDYPQGFKWRSELSDGQVRELQKKGGRVVILEHDYKLQDLQDARRTCQSTTDGAKN